MDQISHAFNPYYTTIFSNFLKRRHWQHDIRIQSSNPYTCTLNVYFWFINTQFYLLETLNQCENSPTCFRADGGFFNFEDISTKDAKIAGFWDQQI
jgi:hypothetical protein